MKRDNACPFCGDKTTYVLADKISGQFFRWCTNCKATGPHKDSPEAASEAWRKACVTVSAE